MKRNIRLSIYICLFFLYSSCIPGEVSNPVLLRAESLMECQPDSALLLLQSIDQPQEMDRVDRAFYALLFTQAEDKNYIEHTSDSLIKVAFDYYQRYGNTRQKMESWYYLASVYRDLGDAPRAIEYFQQAIKIPGSNAELKLLTRIYSEMGTLFFYQRLPEEGVGAYKKMHDYAVLANDSARLANSYIVMARAYTELDNVDSIVYYYKEAANMARRLGRARPERMARNELADIYLQLDKVEEAQCLLVDTEKDEVDYLLWGELYEKKGKIDSSQYSYIKALELGGLSIKKVATEGLYRLAKSCGKEKKALYYLEQSTLYNDSVQRNTDTENVKRIESLYAYQHITSENNRLLLTNKSKERIILSVSIALLATILFLGYFWKRMKDQKEYTARLNNFHKQEFQKKIDEYNDEINILRQQLLNSSLDNIQGKEFVKERLDKTVEEKSKMIEVRQEAETAFRISAIYQYVHRVGRNGVVEMTDEYWLELQKEIDKTYNDLTARLYLLYPRLKQNELRVCLLVKARVANSDMATLLCLGANSISSIRARLFEKIHNKKGKAKDFDAFIEGL